MSPDSTAYSRGFTDACRILWYVVAHKLDPDQNPDQIVLLELIGDLRDRMDRELDDELLEELGVRDIRAFDRL